VADEPRLASESIAGQRPYQEDAVLAQSLSDGRVLVAVADGMGGHAAGEVASALALKTLLAALEGGHAIDRAFEMANREVHEKARDPGKQGMGTTLVAALIDDGEYMVANVGDSRGYLLSGAGIRQLTDDHSFVAEAMKRGQTEEEAMGTPWRDALTRSIGTEADVQVDVFGPFPVQANTALLICSDGLYKTLDDDEMRTIFVDSGGPRGAAQTLVSAALENGSDDNISVAIAEHGEVPRTLGQSTVTMAYELETQDHSGPVTSGPTADVLESPTDPDDGDVEVTGEVAASMPLEPRVEPVSGGSEGFVGGPGLPVAAMVGVGAAAVLLLAWLVLRFG